MDGGLIITFISVAMFVGSFLLGFIPLLFRLSEVSDFPQSLFIADCLDLLHLVLLVVPS